MPLLSRAKRRVGTSLASAAMHADAKQTVIDAGIFLIGVQRIPLGRRPIGGIVSLDERTREAGIGVAGCRARERGVGGYEQ
jgi:hypothetical protein